MTLNRPFRAGTRALLLGLLVLLVTAVPVAAHAELKSSDPADKAEVVAPFDGPITLTFSEALASGSKADLKGPDGSTIAAAKVDGDKLVFTLAAPLPLGNYTIQWTSVASDRDVLRGTLTFTVVEPPPTPTPAPTATPGATAIPTPSPVPTASPTPSGDGSPASGSADVVFPLLAALIALGAIGAFLLLRSRRTAGR